jgi:hypothetical protein
MYGVTAAGNLLLAVPSAVPAWFPRTFTDAAGRRWLIGDLVGMCIVVSVFVMAPFVVMAWVRAGGSGRAAGIPESGSSLGWERVSAG